jgi:prepilin-type N-terminal cleavage/methylation domain-containing protein
MKMLRYRSGFTLVEMLTAIVVLLLIDGLMSQMIGLISTSWRTGTATIDNFTRARALTDSIYLDLSESVLRPGDMTAFRDQNGNPALIFYTTRPGFQAGPAPQLRPLTLIEYTYTGTQVQRTDMPLNWNDSNQSTIFGQTGQIPLATNFSGQTPRQICAGVVAFSIVFLEGSGSLQASYDTNSVAVIITLAAVDSGSLKLLQNASLLSALQSSAVWQVNATSVEPPLSQWQAKIDAGQLQNQIPKTLAGNVQLFQRVVYLPYSLPHS